MQGPEHDREFTTRVVISGREFPDATAHNKKQSEHKAAGIALKVLEDENGRKKWY